MVHFIKVKMVIVLKKGILSTFGSQIFLNMKKCKLISFGGGHMITKNGKKHFLQVSPKRASKNKNKKRNGRDTYNFFDQLIYMYSEVGKFTIAKHCFGGSGSSKQCLAPVAPAPQPWFLGRSWVYSNHFLHNEADECGEEEKKLCGVCKLWWLIDKCGGKIRLKRGPFSQPPTQKCLSFE